MSKSFEPRRSRRTLARAQSHGTWNMSSLRRREQFTGTRGMQAVRSLSLPSQVQTVLEWWFPRVKVVLGHNLLSVMLFGSVCMDDFCPAWSDLDVCAVLSVPVTDEQARRLSGLHDELESLLPGPLLEATYLPSSMAATAGSAGRSFDACHGERSLAVFDPIPGFYRLQLARFSTCYAGETVPFAPPTHDQLVAGSTWLLNRLRGAPGTQRAHELAGLIHETARMVVFWRDREFLSKGSALQREIAAHGQFADAYRLAVHLRTEGGAHCDAHIKKLRDLTRTMAASGPTLLESLISDASRRDENG